MSHEAIISPDSKQLEIILLYLQKFERMNVVERDIFIRVIQTLSNPMIVMDLQNVSMPSSKEITK
jgi:hypothetical protein